MHPTSPRPDAASVAWSPVQQRTDRVRVRAHTCECLPLVFEQCRAGGLGFVRRHDRSVSPWIVVDSPWMKVGDAEVLWQRIMRGEAR
ncbi:hypothetical protein [Nonomuraea sp. NEAU-A123]|uniref:hypothetical protein n=1 Tax=Nonomuraea sp. NEAU-A123 TaxID=2839649 RepID=UPI001BE41A7A|nr:hypothetical protein [Nonomuraea sp. NEAU-A123]MBT2232294.1 hypothetical protein [Nonomuraea sp. NEAU-A123]